QQRLVLARDRAGKKPLFYVHTASRLAFASEIKAFFALGDFDAAVDPDAIPSYFLHGYVPCPGTLYRGVRQVEPGTLIVVDRDGRLSSRVYWQLKCPGADDRRREHPDQATATATLRTLVTSAVERRLVSDVPLGAFLSGGVDSTIVVGLMSRLLD